MRRAIKSINEDALRTERLLKELERHRAFQRSMNFKDDTHDDGQMLTAAMNYANLARQQIKSRNPNWTEEYRHNRKPWVAAGGSDSGYAIPKPMKDPPSDWPWEDTMWVPGQPRYNLIRAATLIVAELERLERADRKALGLDNKPKPVAKADQWDAYADVVRSAYGTSAVHPGGPTLTLNPAYYVSNTGTNTWPVGTINATTPGTQLLSTGTI